MTAQPISDAELDRRVLVRVTLIAAAFLVAVGFVNASTLLTDAARAGVVLDPRVPWILEYTSIAVMIGLLPLIVLWERRFPPEPGRWAVFLGAHIAGSLVYSALHVGLMILLRKLVFAALLGRPYFFFDDPLSDMLYEYRKDVLAYALVVLIINLLRGLEEQRREAQAARAEASASGRLTLKSGGRTILLDAKSVEWAQAAANYVEIRAGGRTHLARTSLSALEEQLAAAGIDAARVHRSFIVNRDRVVEIVPARDGDFRVRTADGSDLRGSRRYRHNLPV